MNRLIVFIGIAFIFAKMAFANGKFETYKTNYEKDLEVIELSLSTKMTGLENGYTKALENLLSKVKKAGNLDKTTGVMAELERFNKLQLMPAKPSALLEVKTLQNIFKKRASTYRTGHAKNAGTLSLKYEKSLAALEKKLVSSDKLHEARQVQKEKKVVLERIKNLAETAKKTSTQPRPLFYKPSEGKTIDLGKGIKLEIVWIPPGSFQMGSPDYQKYRQKYEEGPVHKVTISKGFWMGKYEVTQEQWERVMGNNPSMFKGAKKPVETVSWHDCQKFTEKLNTKIAVTVFRLPTEAEWEYACRAGTRTRYYLGDKQSDFTDAGWYRGNSGMKTHEVGQKVPNQWGLYDMHGNVLEWCSDWKGVYLSETVTDPLGPPSGVDRIFRSGGWNDRNLQRASFRNCRTPGHRGGNLGFRVAAVQSK